MLAAVVAGWDIAQGEMFLVSLVLSAVLLWVAVRFAGVRADAFVAGLVIFGYLVGNRGFAQLHAPGVPLLPGEAALGLGLALIGWQAVQTRSLPIRRDALNYFVLTWILLGVLRMPVDFRAYGFVAVRDFAMVYYALFFFLGQAWAEMPAERLWMRRALFVGIALAAPVYYAFDRNADWFTSNLTLAGSPLIFVKSDVAGGFMAAGVLWYAQRFARTRRAGHLLVAAVALFGVIVCNSRAAVVALAVGIAWLVALRAWRVLRVVGALVAVGLAGLCVHTAVTPRPFVSTPLYRLYESVASVTDTQGARMYLANDLDDKSDNNQFRLVWWRAVAEETWANGRWLGLGFGSDLAAEFLRIYYADANEDFSARSPHNFLLTIFGRMGLLGLAGLIVVLAIVARKTWRAGTAEVNDADNPTPSLPLWLSAWTILASACFGVVLEGPMGATIFWTLLGLAHGTPTSAAESASTDEAAVATEAATAVAS